MKTRVVNIRREKCDIYIGRPSQWGNPYKLGRDGDRGLVISRYRAYILSRPDLLRELPTLKGKKLGCYCAPQECHGDVLVELCEALADAA